MSQSVEKAAHPLDSALGEMAPIMASSGDGRNAERLLELKGKLAAGKLTVAFCGHFSAGKSTLVNRLCGTNLLPSSPIPTSANVVSIANGPSQAAITRLTDGKAETLVVPLDKVNEYCVDGESVQSVTLTYPIPRLGGHTVLLDTPGIDSTDDAHRMATESALHMADVVFYVMDYNHVQSEINFTFAKQLKEWGKPLYLIVNQIDKHRERELTFADYRRSVEEAFANWHLEPSGIVYLSLREPDHPHSEWKKLESLLSELAELRGPLSLCSVDASARHLVRMHGKFMEEQAEPERERLLEIAGGETAAEEVKAELAALEAELAALAGESEAVRSQLLAEVQSLLDNANVIPASTRDLAGSFLESRKPGFKAGFLFAGAKTAAEQERRLQAFRDDFAAQVNAAIEWHLNDVLRKAADAAGWRGESVERELAATIHYEVEPQWMLGHVNPGAVFGGEYTMNYCRELAADIKGLYRKRAMAWADKLAEMAAAAGEAAAAPLRERLGGLAAQAGALAELAALAERAAAHLARLAALLPPAPPRPALPKPQQTAGEAVQRQAGAARGPAAGERSAALLSGVQHVEDAEQREVNARVANDMSGARSTADASKDGQHAVEASVAGRGGPHNVVPGAAELDDARLVPSAGTQESAVRDDDKPAAGRADGAFGPQRLAAQRLSRAADLLAPYDALAGAVQSMREKALRLGESRFTIALFGAFSAGKSSLANALLGDSVLPVSPNPTTAAVNRIVPPTAEAEHGTAAVVMKSRGAIIDDLKYSLNLLGEDADRLSEDALLQKIGKLSPDGIHAGGRPHYSFLKAAAKGWSEHERLLGQRILVDTETYRRYVAEEWRSCFVSEIELHHRNALTEEGIVLVDTPGADSVNARHTGVAFNYIKNADAILFVTYYNHAFSQADRQFLMQLGRVKDQFELDKMFFIVNAADLAASDEELQGVLAHVERNLQQHGIRFPRMFPISSLQALDGKQLGNPMLLAASGIAAFEEAFLSFARNDLGSLAVTSAEQELERARRTIAGWIEAASGDAETREAAKANLAEDVRTALNAASEMETPQANPQLSQELKELLHYVLQRVQYRFGDLYNYAFNPSSLQDDGRDLRKALWTSWLELQRLLQIELAQELQATSLRLDNALNKLAAKRFADAAADAAKSLEGFEPSAFKPSQLPTPDDLPAWQADNIEAKWLWARFKSPRQFFEGEGKAALRSAFEAELSAPLQSWIASAEEQWSGRYAQLWHDATRECAQTLRGDIESFANGKLASLNAGSGDLERLSRLHTELCAI